MASFLSNITVEPVSFFTFLGLVMYQLVRDTGLYRTVCMQKYSYRQEDDIRAGGIDCLNLTDHRDIENDVQREATLWIMLYSLAVLLPAMFSDILLGAWGDRRGRKNNMLFGIVGTIVAVVPLIALLTFPGMPIYTVIFANLVCGVMGSSAIVMVSSYAYLADLIKDHNLLTTRMAVLSVAISSALISGSYIGGVLVRYLTLPECLCVVIGVLLLGFLYCLLRIEQKPPPQLTTTNVLQDQQQQRQQQVEEPNEAVPLLKCQANSTCCSELILTIKSAKNLLKEVWSTISQKRAGNHRAYILIGVGCFHIATLADFQGNVISLFVYRYPLEWSPSMLATWRACTGAVGLVGGTICALLLKRVLKFRDTTLILLGLASAFSQNAVLGLSTRTWMVYASSGFGMFSSIAQPAICSLTTRLVRRDEVGKAFAAFTLAAEMALILSAVLLNSIYQATITFFPGLVFFFVSGCVLVLAAVPMLWVHRNYDEEAEELQRRGESTNSNTSGESDPD